MQLSSLNFLLRWELARGSHDEQEGDFQCLKHRREDYPDLNSWIRECRSFSPSILNKQTELMGVSLLKRLLIEFSPAVYFSHCRQGHRCKQQGTDNYFESDALMNIFSMWRSDGVDSSPQSWLQHAYLHAEIFLNKALFFNFSMLWGSIQWGHYSSSMLRRLFTKKFECGISHVNVWKRGVMW